MRRRKIRYSAHKPRFDRRAVSLVELLIVMSMRIVVLSIAMGTLHRVFQADRRARVDLSMQQTVGRLSRLLRQDVHQAVNVEKTTDETEADGGWQKWRLQDDMGVQVDYMIRGPLVRRREMSGDRPVHNEEFQLPDACEVTCELAETPQRVVMTVWLTASVYQLNPDTSSLTAREIGRRLVGRISAVVGRDHRFHRAGTNNGDPPSLGRLTPPSRTRGPLEEFQVVADRSAAPFTLPDQRFGSGSSP